MSDPHLARRLRMIDCCVLRSNGTLEHAAERIDELEAENQKKQERIVFLGKVSERYHESCVRLDADNRRMREALNMVRIDATMPDWLEGVVEAALQEKDDDTKDA